MFTLDTLICNRLVPMILFKITFAFTPDGMLYATDFSGSIHYIFLNVVLSSMNTNLIQIQFMYFNILTSVNMV